MSNRSNKSLNAAKSARNDEFYTLRSDIDAELQHYEECFKGKTVYCNCDDWRESKFVEYFLENFDRLQLKRLNASCYVDPQLHLFEPRPEAYAEMMTYNGKRQKHWRLKMDGDFRSAECYGVLRCSDIIVTNPPFSLIKEYVPLLMDCRKQFLIVAPVRSFLYRDIYFAFESGKVSFGFNRLNKFRTGIGDIVAIRQVYWMTNLHSARNIGDLSLEREYSHDLYDYYDNYPAIEVSHISDIPVDYWGIMGIPTSFLPYWNPAQFRLMGVDESAWRGGSNGLWDSDSWTRKPCVNGKELYARVFIQLRNR